MRRRVLLVALAGLSGLLLFIDPAWLGVLLLLFVALKSKRSDWPLLLSVVLLFGVLGYRAAERRTKPPLPQGSVRVLPGDWSVKDTLITYTGRAANGVVTGGQAVATTEQILQLKARVEPIVVQWTGDVERLNGATNQYEFDYRQYRWMTAEQAYALPRQPLKFTAEKADGVIERIVAWRALLQRRLERLPKTVGRYARGLLLGQTDSDFDTVREQLVTLGIVHLFSVSGLHLFALFSLLYALTDRLRIVKERVDWALLLTLPALVILIPSGAGIVRAVLFRMLLILNDRLSWHYSRLDLLSGALLINLLFQPFVLHTFGGQMSYLMTAALITGPTSSRLKTAWRLWLMGTPIVIAQTFRVHVLAVLFNWLLVPIFESLLLPLLAFVALFPDTPVTEALDFGLRLGEGGLAMLAGLPGEVIFGAIALPTTIAGVVAAALSVSGRRPWPLFAWLVFTLLTNAYKPNYRVTIFDVGQGDAILVEAPFRRGTVLIDTGGLGFGVRRNPPAKRVILNYLAARGISALDALVLTHPDADHVGDAVLITEGVPVRQLVVTDAAYDNHYVEAARAGKVKQTIRVKSGDKILAGEIRLQVVAPNNSGDGSNKNEDSIVLYGTIDSKRWLFTGDADQQVEMTQLLPQNLQSDFLKVGHHGSRTSSAPDFVSALQLQAGFISSGRNNRYGHPHQETLTTFKDAAVPLYNTARSGMLWVEEGKIHQFLNEE